MNFLGTNLFDIKQVTNWPDDFIDDLSFEAGSNNELFQHEEFQDGQFGICQ